MAAVLKFRNKKTDELAEELRKISELIEISEKNFNEIDNEDLIEAAIFDRSALMARYAYLMKELKKIQEAEK